MILKTCFLLILSVAWEVSGASFSNVYFKTGLDAAPARVEYIQSGAPSVTYTSPQIAQFNAASVGYEYPWSSSYISYGAPCSDNGCFYPGKSVASVAEVAPSANVIAYNAPVSNLPVVYTPAQNDQTGYQYSYVVLDQRSGDHKVHSELSDGEAVRGEYSFLQPDGFVREVQYVADNEQGFNAIVKSILPEVKHTEISHHALPCHDAKSGALIAHDSHHEFHETIGSHEEHHEGLEQHADHEHHEARNSGHEEMESGHHESVEYEERHVGHGGHEGHKTHESHKSKGSEESDEDHENLEEHVKNIKIIVVEPETPMHKSVEASEEHQSHEKLIEGSHAEHEEEDNKDIEVIVVEKPTHENQEASEGHHTHAKLIEGSHIEAFKLNRHEVNGHGSHHSEHLESHQASTHENGNNGVLSYENVIKCIESAMSTTNNHPSVPSTSPLAYLILKKPC